MAPFISHTHTHTHTCAHTHAHTRARTHIYTYSRTFFHYLLPSPLIVPSLASSTLGLIVSKMIQFSHVRFREPLYNLRWILRKLRRQKKYCKLYHISQYHVLCTTLISQNSERWSAQAFKDTWFLRFKTAKKNIKAMKSKIKNNFYQLQVRFTKLNQLYIYNWVWQNFQNLRNTRGVTLVEYLRNNRQDITFSEGSSRLQKTRNNCHSRRANCDWRFIIDHRIQ